MIWILAGLHFILATSTAVVIILFGVRPTRSFSWLLLVLFFPFIGVIFYLLLGINRKKFKFFQLKETKKRQLYNRDFDKNIIEDSGVTFESINKQRLALLVEQTTHFGVLPNNRVEILNEASKAYDYIFESVSQAQKFIHLQYYIFKKEKFLTS